MLYRFLTIVSLPLLALLMQNARASAQDHAAEVVGSISFETSCAPAAQREFDRAVAMLHSFWFERARQTFADAAALDPDCAMPWWGQAMTLWGNSMTRAAPTPENESAA